MRAQLLLLPAPISASALLPSPQLPHFRFSRRINSPVTSAAARSRRDSDEASIPNGRSGFGVEDDVFGGGNRRSWWSNYDDDDDDDKEELGIDDDFGFGVLKIFRAFGWMVPAVAISLLLGTGPNAFVMALAVPLGQTLISLVFDKVWGWTVDRPKPSARRNKTRKKPFSRAANGTSRSTGKRESGPRGGYQSWASRDGLNQRGDSKGRKFGGWDDLDPKTRADDFSRTSSGANGEGSQQKPDMTGKLSRVGRVRERPLLMRLLVAAFPFLGWWTKFLF